MGIEIEDFTINMDFAEKKEEDFSGFEETEDTCRLSKEEIIAACVKQVLAILKERDER